MSVTAPLCPQAADQVALAIADPVTRRAALCAMVPGMARWLTTVHDNPASVRRVPASWLQVLHRCLDAETSRTVQAADRRVVAQHLDIQPLPADALPDRQGSESAGGGESSSAGPGERSAIAEMSGRQWGQMMAGDRSAAAALLEDYLAATNAVDGDVVDVVVEAWCDRMCYRSETIDRSAAADRLESVVARLADQRLMGALGPVPWDQRNIIDALGYVERLDVLTSGGPLNAHALNLLLYTSATVSQFADVIDARGMDRSCALVIDDDDAPDCRTPLGMLVADRLGHPERLLAELDDDYLAGPEWFEAADRLSTDPARAVLRTLLDVGEVTDDMDLARLLALGERVGWDAATTARLMTGPLLVEFALTADPMVLRDYLTHADRDELFALAENLDLRGDDAVRLEVLLHGAGMATAVRDRLIDGAPVWQICAELLGDDTGRWEVLWSLLGTWEGSVVELLTAVEACRAE
jgi:hypothetical protein